MLKNVSKMSLDTVCWELQCWIPLDHKLAIIRNYYLWAVYNTTGSILLCPTLTDGQILSRTCNLKEINPQSHKVSSDDKQDRLCCSRSARCWCSKRNGEFIAVVSGPYGKGVLVSILHRNRISTTMPLAHAMVQVWNYELCLYWNN